MDSKTLSQAMINEAIRQTPSLYLLKYYTLKRKPITFSIKERNMMKARAHRPFQCKIIDDLHENKIVRKSRQLGLSEMGVAEALHFADVKGDVKIVFTFPRERQLTDFVKSRLNPVLEGNPYFKSILNKATDSLQVKQVRESFLFFRSAWGGALGEGVDADFVAFDEYDRMKDDVELAFQESMKSSHYGWLRRWSTPTIPGRGVDKIFQNSDQHFYMHRCDHCNHSQILSIEDNIMCIDEKGIDHLTDEIKEGTYDFVCAKCKRHLDRWYNGFWEPAFPSRRESRGYHISQLNAVWISADDIMRRQLKYTSRQLFNNYVVGEPYAASGLLITDHDVNANMRFEDMKNSRAGYQKIVVGIDWGIENRVMMMGIKEDGQKEFIHVWTFKDNPERPLDAVKHIAASITPFDPDLIVADYGYGADRNALLMQLFPGRTWACKYQTFKSASQPINKWNENARLVTVDKTLTTQRLIHAIKGREVGYWKMDANLAEITKHYKNVRIMDEEDDEGNFYQVATRVGRDDLFAASNYCLIGAEKLKNPYQKQSNLDWEFI